MKKVLTGFLVVAVLLTIGTTGAFAAEAGAGRHFIDANGDGVCDNWQGVCRYVDANGDGICDNYAANQPRGGGRGWHCRYNR